VVSYLPDNGTIFSDSGTLQTLTMHNVYAQIFTDVWAGGGRAKSVAKSATKRALPYASCFVYYVQLSFGPGVKSISPYHPPKGPHSD
jgi:hypothetical protein